MRNEFLVFGQPQIQKDEIDDLVAVMESGWLGTGPRVSEFEARFADYKSISKNQVAAVNSCTAALHISMISAGLEAGDEVITTAMTFCATANAIIHAGATPVIADIDPETLNIDPDDLESRITERTRAIVPVHFAGRPCEMTRLSELAEKHGLIMIEDCAHAIETEYDGIKAGNFGDYSCFSFYVTKNVITGEGGMVLTKEPNNMERVKVLSLHGMSKDAWSRYSDEGYKHYKVVDCGYKYNMTDLQAAIGIRQLSRVEQNWKRRREIWGIYQSAFAELPFLTPQEPAANTRHAYHLYTVQIDKKRSGICRDQFLEKINSYNIGVGVHYLCLADHPYYQDRFGWQKADYPNATRFGDQTVSLPLSARLSDDDVQSVIDAVHLLFGTAREQTIQSVRFG